MHGGAQLVNGMTWFGIAFNATVGPVLPCG